jgi:signal transduction histidine kinase/CheY-like chemotaxis protein
MRSKRPFCFKCLLNFLLIIISLPALAQNESEKGLPFITNYTSKMLGSLNSINWSIIEDNDGMMYFGENKTKTNLWQYDGVRFVIIPCPPSSAVIRSLAKDKNGVIYYGGLGDFGYLDKDSIGTTYEHSLLSFVPNEKRNFTDVWTTQITDKGIYFQSRDWLFRLTKTGSDKNASWSVKTWQPATHFMYTFYQDGDFYVHEQGRGLFKMENDLPVLIPGSEFLGEDRVQIMLPYTNDAAQKNSASPKQYLLGTFNHGMYLFDGKNFKSFRSEADSLIKNYMLYKGILINGNYAFSLLGYGLVVMNPQGKIVQIINQVNSGLPSNIIYSIYADSKGAVWLGLDNGISKLALNSPFTVFNGQNGISAGPLSVARALNGTLYVGTNNNLLQFNQTDSKFETNNLIPKDQVFTVLPDGNTVLVTSNGLYMIKEGKVILIQPSVSNNLKISALNLSKKYPNILYAGSSFGIAIFTRDASTIKGWKYLGYLPGFKNEVFTLAEDEAGSIWTVATNGIAYRITISADKHGNIDMPKTRVENFGPEQGLKRPLLFVFAIKKKIYFASDSATYTFNKEKNNFEETSFQGISNFNAFTDSTGKLWMASGTIDNTRYIIAKPGSNGNYELDSTSLLPVIGQSIQNLYPDKNGIVWFFTNDGLIRYDQKIKINIDQPYKTLIRSITADKQNLNPDSASGNSTEIKHNSNSLRFEYAAPFYEQEDKTQYQTWLEGFEKTWSDLGKNTYKEYTNLSAGKYVFHVRAKNIYNKISAESTYSFIILPPWYSTWLAYVLYALAVLFIIYIVVNWRTKKLKEKHAELEKIVEQRTHELSQRVEELAVINSVQEALVSEMDMQGIYNVVGERIRNVFNAQAVIIATLNEDHKTEEFNYTIEKGERFYIQPRPYDKLREHLIQSKEKILINNNYEEAASKFGMNVLPGTEHPKSLVFVPLIIANKVTSYVSLQNIDQENAFSESDVRLLETLANSMSVALENARLFNETNRLLKETEQRTAELAVINSVQDGLVREMDIQGIYNLVGDRLRQLFSAQAVIIASFDFTTGTENFNYVFENGEKFDLESRPISNMRQQIIDKRHTIYIETEESARDEYGIVALGDTKMPKSLLFVPLLSGNEVRGYVSLQNIDIEHAFSVSDIRLLETLANSMTVALQNARLFDETTVLLADAKQRANELATVNSISKALATQLNPDELIHLVGDQMKNLFRANIVYLALLNKQTNIIHFPYQYGDNLTPMKLGDGLTSKIILTGEPIFFNKDVQTKTGELGVKRVGVPAASYLGVPIPVGDEIVGVLSVQSTEHENRFNENDLRLLTTIASSVGVALKNAQLFEEVEQAKMQAEISGKNAEKANEAKSAFLSTVSHELRTPLTSVLGFAKIIRKRLEEKIFPALDTSDVKLHKATEQISENLKVVISEGERLTHLINDVLDLAKIEAGKMEWNQENVSLADVIERAVAATTSLFEQKDIRLVKDVGSNIPEIIADRDKLIQVVINLFSNAVKFTNEGSVSCKLYQKDNEVVVSIADTGIGIAKEDYGAVFEQFKQVGGDTLTDKPKGTGLGLPICKEILEHHGGRIWVESEVGKGSTFFFALPVTPGVHIEKETPIHLNDLMKQLREQMAFSKLKTDGKNATILVVDDDDSIRSLLQQELSDVGYLIEEARDGKMALECIRKNRPDLIILDVMMPEINGFDVAAILKNDPQTMDIPIIILSIVQDKARGFRIGVDRYLTKPIDTTKLFEEVESLLEQGKSKKKVMVVDEDSSAVRSLTEVLQAKGYIVVASDGNELIEKAISSQPDIIILNSVLSDQNHIVQSLRFEKGLENVLFVIYQ